MGTAIGFIKILDVEFDFQELDAILNGFKDHSCDLPLNRI